MGSIVALKTSPKGRIRSYPKRKVNQKFEYRLFAQSHSVNVRCSIYEFSNRIVVAAILNRTFVCIWNRVRDTHTHTFKCLPCEFVYGSIHSINTHKRAQTYTHIHQTSANIVCEYILNRRWQIVSDKTKYVPMCCLYFIFLPHGYTNTSEHARSDTNSNTETDILAPLLAYDSHLLFFFFFRLACLFHFNSMFKKESETNERI